MICYQPSQTISIYYAKAFLAFTKPAVGPYPCTPDYSGYDTLMQPFEKFPLSANVGLHVYTSPSFVLNYLRRNHALDGQFRLTSTLRLFCTAYIRTPKLYNHLFIPLFLYDSGAVSRRPANVELSLFSAFFLTDKMPVYRALFFSNLFAQLFFFKTNLFAQLLVTGAKKF